MSEKKKRWTGDPQDYAVRDDVIAEAEEKCCICGKKIPEDSPRKEGWRYKDPDGKEGIAYAHSGCVEELINEIIYATLEDHEPEPPEFMDESRL